jgi:hypothetical protein
VMVPSVLLRAQDLLDGGLVIGWRGFWRWLSRDSDGCE